MSYFGPRSALGLGLESKLILVLFNIFGYPGHMGEQWVTIDTASKVFNVKDRTIRRWIKAGKLTAKKQGGRVYVAIDSTLTETLVTGDDYQELVERLRIELKNKSELVEHLKGEVDFLRNAHAASLSQIQQLLTEAKEQEKRKRPWWRRGGDND